jgi:hypothetical protein
MELDELYCDVIVERWQGFTGKKACRAGEADGQAETGRRAKSCRRAANAKPARS